MLLGHAVVGEGRQVAKKYSTQYLAQRQVQIWKYLAQRQVQIQKYSTQRQVQIWKYLAQRHVLIIWFEDI